MTLKDWGMAYRNGTYVAFDGLGTTDPTKGDIKYFNLLKRWNTSRDFNFSDSHRKTYQVLDLSTKITLQTRLSERLRHSKNMVLILTTKTRHNREMLNYEIKRAVELRLPIIVCYPEVKQPIFNPQAYSSYWPKSLADGIECGKAQCIHVPFKRALISDALSQFSLHAKEKLGPLNYYRKDAYDFLNVKWT